MTYPQITTTVEPPGMGGEDDDTPRLITGCHIQEADGTFRSGVTMMDPDADDVDIADGLVRSMLATATARGPGVLAAVRRRLTAETHPGGIAWPR